MRGAFPDLLAAGLAIAALVAAACTVTADLDSLKGEPGSGGSATGGAPSGGGGSAGAAGGSGGNVTVSPKPPLSRVSAGALHGCVIDVEGSVFCWGSNLGGQLGTGKLGGKQGFFHKVAMPGAASEVSAGGNHTCAIAGGEVHCWGRGQEGQVGTGTADQYLPTKVPGLSGADKISAGGNHTCAIAGGELFCWGSNGRGQLGVPGGDSASPLKPGLTGVTAVSAGPLNSCAVAAGNAYCWGANDFGQVGDKALPLTQTEPSEVTLAASPIRVATGGQHACAITQGGGAFCWGNNKDGQLGIGSAGEVGVAPTKVLSINVSEIAAGEAHTCAITTTGNGEVACWGADDRGQIGNGSGGPANAPAVIGKLSSISQVAAGTRFSCVLAAGGGTLHCWGDNLSSQLGELTLELSPDPVILPLQKNQ